MDNSTRRQLIKKATIWHFNLGKGVITVAASYYKEKDITFYGVSYCSPLDQFCKADGKSAALMRLRETVNSFFTVVIEKEAMTVSYIAGCDAYYGPLEGNFDPLAVLRELTVNFYLLGNNPNWVFKALKRGHSFEPRVPRSKRRKDKRAKMLATVNTSVKMTGTTLKKNRNKIAGYYGEYAQKVTHNGKARKNTPGSSTNSPT